MVYCEESDVLLFLASPLLDGLESLNKRGLFISDIPLHDATRDVILIGEQSRAQVLDYFYVIYLNSNILFLLC
jgi:guanylate cyclase soluble subunit alpha